MTRFLTSPDWVIANDGRFRFVSDTRQSLECLQPFFLPDPDILFQQGEEIFSGRWGDATDTVKVCLCGKKYLLKRYNPRGRFYSVKNALRTPRCLRAFAMGHRLAAGGVPTPRPLLAIVERSVLLLGRSYILFPYIEQTENLLELWPRPSADARREILSALGEIIGRMHAQGFHHGDLNWRNILVRRGETGYDIYLVDLDGCHYGHPTEKSLRHDLRHFMRDFERTQTPPELVNIFWQRWGSFVR